MAVLIKSKQNVVCKIKVPVRGRQKQREEMYDWYSENCNGHWYCDQLYKDGIYTTNDPIKRYNISFEHETDAMGFKLRFM